MTHNIIFTLILLIGIAVEAKSTDSLNTVLDLESKISTKIKAIVQPVDPDSIIITEVEVKKISTNLAGTSFEAVSIFSTSEPQTINDNDIESIKVIVVSTLIPFPEDIKDLLNKSIKSFSSKGSLQILKMGDHLQSYRKSWQKTMDLAEQVFKMIKETPVHIENAKKNIVFVILIDSFYNIHFYNILL